MKLFVWDFHGVMEEGNDDVICSVTNHILSEEGHKERISIDQCISLTGRHWSDYYATVLMDHPEDYHNQLHHKSIQKVLETPEHVVQFLRPASHIHYVLEQVYHSSHDQIIVSNCEPRCLDICIDTLGLRHFFPPEKVFGVDHTAKEVINKKKLVREYLKKNDHVIELVTIGDSPGDMELKEEHSKSTSYLYAHPGRTHRKATADFQISDLRAVLKEI